MSRSKLRIISFVYGFSRFYAWLSTNCQSFAQMNSCECMGRDVPKLFMILWRSFFYVVHKRNLYLSLNQIVRRCVHKIFYSWLTHEWFMHMFVHMFRPKVFRVADSQVWSSSLRRLSMWAYIYVLHCHPSDQSVLVSKGLTLSDPVPSAVPLAPRTHFSRGTRRVWCCSLKCRRSHSSSASRAWRESTSITSRVM